jgi:hypothetical protein
VISFLGRGRVRQKIKFWVPSCSIEIKSSPSLEMIQDIWFRHRKLFVCVSCRVTSPRNFGERMTSSSRIRNVEREADGSSQWVSRFWFNERERGFHPPPQIKQQIVQHFRWLIAGTSERRSDTLHYLLFYSRVPVKMDCMMLQTQFEILLFRQQKADLSHKRDFKQSWLIHTLLKTLFQSQRSVTSKTIHSMFADLKIHRLNKYKTYCL